MRKWRITEMPKLSQAKIDAWKRKHAQSTISIDKWAKEAITKEEVLRNR
jgi:hypothetical protein